MITHLKLSSLRADEAAVVMKRVIDIFDQAEQSQTPLTPFQEMLVKAYENYFSSRKKVSTNEKTLKVETADAKRDAAGRALFGAIKACTLRVHPEFRTNAKKLLYAIKQYGLSLHKESYGVQTSKLNDLFVRIDSDEELTAALGILVLTEWYNDLKIAQTEFEQALKDRGDFEVEKENQLSIEESRTLMFQAYETLVNYIDAMAKVYPLDYEQYVSQLNIIIEDFNIQIKRRETSKEEISEE